MDFADNRGVDVALIGHLFNRLEGTWRGKGEGGYPTIASFHYRELLSFQRRDQKSLFYVQRTEKRTPDGQGYALSHWESGFLRHLQDGTLELANIQIGGRGELLIGKAQREGAKYTMRFKSESLSNDARMIATTRVMQLDGHELIYEMKMQTIAVGELTHHLRATLERVASGLSIVNVNFGEE